LKAYEAFLHQHPKHVEGWLAFGSFMNEVGDHEGATAHWETARGLAPNNPAAWNNLANVFGHDGPIKKALIFYERAIELDPREPVYLHNLAIMTFLYRKDVRQTYRITEEEVFDKSLELYRRALRLDPTNFVLSADYAQSYYGIKPLRLEAAMEAWNDTLKLASTESDREGVHLHMARVQTMAGKFDEARRHLERVRLAEHDEVKARLLRSVEQRSAQETPATPEPPKPR
jgi:tetratricopeptide (TPR) repeat protein